MGSAPPIEFRADFLPPPQADEILAELLRELPWQRHESRLYGRPLVVPRQEVWLADRPYTYSRRTYPATPWTAAPLRLKAMIEAAAGCPFNSALANLYESGADSVGWHADAEPEMSHDHPIASLSLGAAREFQMRRGDGPIFRLELTHGSLLLMAAGMQREWRHRVPKTRRARGPRVNLTFRRMA